MLRGDDDDEPVLAVGQHGEPGRRGVAPVDADVGGAVGNGADDDRADRFFQSHVNQGMRLQEPAEVAGQVLDHRRVVREDLEAAAHPLRVLADFAVHLGEVAHQHARVMQEGVTGGRGPKSGMVTAEELHLGRLLEIGDALADRGGRDVLALGRLGDALLLHHRDEELQGEQIDNARR